MARFNKNNYRKQLREEDKRYAALRKEQQREEKRKLKKQRNIFLKIKEAQKKNEEEQEAIEKEKESRRERFESFGKKSLSNANKLKKKFKKNIKRARRGKVAKIISRFFIPGMLINSFFLLTFFVMFEVYAGGIVGTIAGLANPQQRAILQAKGIIGDKDVTTIPSYLIGDEPDLKGGSYMSNKNLTGSSGQNGDMNQNAYAVYLHYKGKLTDEEIAGMLGCFQEESNINFHRFEADYTAKGKSLGWDGAKKDDFDPSKMFGSGWASFLNASNPSGYKNGHGGYTLGLGIGQFTGPRGYNLIHSGDNWDKPNNQMNWMDTKDKFNGWDGTKSWHYWSNGNDVSAATTDFLAHWEGNPGNKLSVRLSDARSWLQKIKDGSIKCSLPGGSSGNNNSNKSNGNGGNNNSGGGDSISSLPDSAKWIMQKESGGNIHATNGRYYGLFQLDKSYYQNLCGKSYDQTNEADQIKAATAYMKQRYNTWDKAKAFWQANGWW